MAALRMHATIPFGLAGLLAGCSPPPPGLDPALPPGRHDLASELLSAHNRERAAAMVAPLHWDPGLAAASAESAFRRKL